VTRPLASRRTADAWRAPAAAHRCLEEREREGRTREEERSKEDKNGRRERTRILVSLHPPFTPHKYFGTHAKSALIVFDFRLIFVSVVK
jgi:hypothetical protein